MKTVASVNITAEEELRLLEELRRSDVLALMDEKGIEEPLANRYFVVLQVIRDIQTLVSLLHDVPYGGISYGMKFEWISPNVDPLRRYDYGMRETGISLNLDTWSFDEIHITGFDADGSDAFTARVVYYLVPMGGGTHHRH
jgi:hypothetical protein